MRVEHAEAVWLAERGAVTVLELTQCSGLTADEVRELVDLGALMPSDPGSAEPTFDPECISAARVATRLRHDFEVDMHGLALALTLLERIDHLESEVRALRARLPAPHHP